MNERVLEAAFLAGFINKRVSDDSYFVNDPKLMTKLNKFAELIVQECILVIEEEAEHIHAEGTIEAIVNLEKHFGVE